MVFPTCAASSDDGTTRTEDSLVCRISSLAIGFAFLGCLAFEHMKEEPNQALEPTRFARGSS
jgi:hypothetical protein